MTNLKACWSSKGYMNRLQAYTVPVLLWSLWIVGAIPRQLVGTDQDHWLLCLWVSCLQSRMFQIQILPSGSIVGLVAYHLLSFVAGGVYSSLVGDPPSHLCPKCVSIWSAQSEVLSISGSHVSYLVISMDRPLPASHRLGLLSECGLREIFWGVYRQDEIQILLECSDKVRCWFWNSTILLLEFLWSPVLGEPLLLFWRASGAFFCHLVVRSLSEESLRCHGCPHGALSPWLHLRAI